ncbi:MAG: homoserine dehydrogenase [Porticoccaceae bacterium]|nr:homoserine dehydrogenase [Porticoccaceae bacterium]
MSVRVGICGLGTVGGGTVNVLRRNADLCAARAGTDIQIVQIGARSVNPDCDSDKIPVVADVFAVATNPDVDIVVELIGGSTVARELVLAAIASGKHVVTANKALIAEHGNEIFAAAREQGVTVAFEAAVAGGIPIIKALRDGLSANRIEWVAGIINGTGNFILTEMRDKGRDFADVLAEAQALGYAEADPTFDVEGIDAAHKLVILAALAFGMPLRFDAVYTEGISEIAPEDVVYAEELGYRIKHLGIARQREQGVELRVHPTLVPEECLIAQVNGVMNAVMVKGDAVGPTLYYGAGAGAEPTASAVVADIIEIARASVAQSPSSLVPASPLGVAVDALRDPGVLAIADTVSAHYLRVSALDKPGVLSQLATIMSARGISIEALIQKEPRPGEDRVPLIMLTNETLESNLRAALTEIEALESVVGSVVHIRKDGLDGQT